MERLRESEGKYRIDGNALSVSLGFSTMRGEHDLKYHIGQADQQMYTDKQAKKGRG